MSDETSIVIPCYNEAERLREDSILDFSGRNPEIRLLFVDDGSSDDTRARLETLTAGEESLSLTCLPGNRGKAEAVRQGINEAFGRGARYAGFWDADLATPLDEVPRFVEMLDANPDLEVLFGSRVKLLGRTIERRASRHYLGRVAATAISITLGLPVYDTQCGAKLFRGSQTNRNLFAEPFVTRWIFDVEIVARMIRAHQKDGGPDPARAICEVPLREWRDVAGSKVRPVDFLKSMAELLKIRSRYL